MAYDYEYNDGNRIHDQKIKDRCVLIDADGKTGYRTMLLDKLKISNLIFK
jgi:hypothetical protein